jgi:apoptosis-inducing factor 2
VPRALVKPGLAGATYIPIDESKVPGAEFLRGDVVEIGEKEVTVRAVKHEGRGEESKLAFDYLVIASGSSYAGPFKSPELYEKASLRVYGSVVEAVGAARRIAVVGGGAVGVELAGELKTLQAAKDVTLIHSGPHLLSSKDGGGQGLPTFAALGADLKTRLERKGVRVLLNARVDKADRPASVRELTEGVEVGERELAVGSSRVAADLVFWVTGIKPNSGPFRKSFPDRVDARGFIKVDAQLRVEGFRNIFALGDVSNAPGPKAAYITGSQAPVLARNLLRTANADITGVEPASWDNFNPGTPGAIITVGHDDGAGSLFGMAIGGGTTRSIKGTDLFLGKVWGDVGPSPIPADKAAAIAIARP